MLKETNITTDGTQFTKKIIEVPSEPDSSAKSKQRLAIQDNVFDIHDSVADNAKIISLLTSMLMRLYDVTPVAQKEALAVDDRSLIEYVFTKFATTDTRADVQFATEGPAMIDKIMERQGQIGTIING